MEALLEMCAEHAAYERSAFSPEGKREALSEALFGQVPELFCLVAEAEGALIGYATYMRQYSTWDAEAYIYMDCLFLRASARGKGLGPQFMDKIVEEGRKMACSLIQWQTPDFNEGAIRFYRRIGAQSKTKERFFLAIEPE